MNDNFPRNEQPPTSEPVSPTPVTPRGLRVIGVGRAGLNILNRLIDAGLPGAEFASVSADADSLASSQATEKLLLESRQLRGMGSGGDPERGKLAAEENLDRIKAICGDVDVVILLAGLGGGTATGAAPVLAKAARESGALVLAFACLPFNCEGRMRRRNAEAGLKQLKSAADGVICLPNQRVVGLLDESASVVDTFTRTNQLLVEGIRSVWSLMSRRGLLEISFENLCRLLRDRHSESLFAVAEGAGAERVSEVLERLAAHPMLDGGKALAQAEAVLVSVTGGPELSMADVNRIMEDIEGRCDSGEVSMGACVSDEFRGKLRVTLVATCPEPAPNEAAPAEPRAEQAGLFARGAEETDGPGPSRSRGASAGSATTPERVMQRPPARGRKRGSRMRQGQLPLDIVSKGRFDNASPTVLHGENLDLPTYLRRGILLN